jgi:hypothetical protein
MNRHQPTSLSPNVAIAPEADPDSGLNDGCAEQAGTLTTLLATGMSLRDSIATLSGLGATTAQVVGAVLDATGERGTEVIGRLADFLWTSDDPRTAAPELAARGVHPIQMIQVSAGNRQRLITLMALLSEDMGLVRCLDKEGERTVFRHPAGCAYLGRFLASGLTTLAVNSDGSVWTPREVEFAQGVVLTDPDGRLTHLDRSLDAMRMPSQHIGKSVIDLHGCHALERMPAIVDIGAGGTLNLADCPSLVRLPERLCMGDDSILNLTGCLAWDGTFPPGVELGRAVSVILPDGSPAVATPGFHWTAERGLTLPTTKDGLRAEAQAMAKILNKLDGRRGFTAALVKLEAMGVDRNLLLEVLDDWVNDATLEPPTMFNRDPGLVWSYPARLRDLLEVAPTLAAEGIARMRGFVPNGVRFTFSANGNIDAGNTGSMIDTEQIVPSRLEALPPGLRPTHLTLEGYTSLTGLPEGLDLHVSPGHLWGKEVDGSLRLRGCTSFRSLPKTLSCVNLEIRDCPEWDRIVPPEAKVSGLVLTQGHKKGLTLEAWRKAYGFGPGK